MAGSDDPARNAEAGVLRRLRKPAIVLAVILVLLGGPWLLLHLTGREAVRSRIEALRAAGEPVSLAEYEARREVIPDEENSARVIERLADELTAMNEVAKDREGLPVAGKADLPPWGEPWPAEMLAAVESFLASWPWLLGELDAIHDMPRGRFSLDLQANPLKTLVPELAPLRWASKLERLAALRDAAGGDIENALERCRTMFNMSSSVREDPILISALVSMSIEALTVDTIERVLAMDGAGADHLASMQALLGDHEEHPAMLVGMRGERLSQIGIHEYVREGGELSELLGTRVAIPAPLMVLLTGWADLNEARSLDLMEALIEASDDPPRLLVVAREMERRVAGLSRFHLMTKILLPGLDRAVTLWVKHLAALRAAQAGLAAERFRMVERRWPASLAELVPAYMDAVPLDPFDENPLRYKVEADRIVIYSIGEDGVDDAGDLTKPKGRGQSSPDIGFRLLNPELRGSGIEQVE